MAGRIVSGLMSDATAPATGPATAPARRPERRPFRFSSPAAGILDAGALRDRVRTLEDLGYSTVTISDHFDDQLGPIASLMAAAEATTTLRIGALVFSNDFRHPAVVAKEAATLDVLSGGRLEFGLGAGWMDADYSRTGLVKDRPGVRIERLAESIEVIRSLWSEGPTTFHGEHYRIDDLDGLPKPVQQPRPPIIVGGGSEKVLRLAGGMADIVSLNPSMRSGRIDHTAGASSTPQATDDKLSWIRDGAGERFDQIELHVRLEVALVCDDPEPYFEGLSGGFGLTPDEARESPHALLGPPSMMIDRLVERRERWGLSYIGVPQEASEAMAPVGAALAGT